MRELGDKEQAEKVDGMLWWSKHNEYVPMLSNSINIQMDTVRCPEHPAGGATQGSKGHSLWFAPVNSITT